MRFFHKYCIVFLLKPFLFYLHCSIYFVSSIFSTRIADLHYVPSYTLPVSFPVVYSSTCQSSSNVSRTYPLSTLLTILPTFQALILISWPYLTIMSFSMRRLSPHVIPSTFPCQSSVIYEALYFIGIFSSDLFVEIYQEFLTAFGTNRGLEVYSCYYIPSS